MERKTRRLNCANCGKLVVRTGHNQLYCPECSKWIQRRDHVRQNEARKDLQGAHKGMAAIEKGTLEEWTAEARRRGISYGELKTEIAKQKAGMIRKW